MQKTPKILLWDVETSYILAYTFGLYDQQISPANIVDDWFMICASWKWLGDKKAQAVSVLDDDVRFALNRKNDGVVIEKLHEVLSEADILVAHNGDKFDLKKFNARAIQHGLTPLPPIKTIDTLKVARKEFKFTSNRLDFLAQHLGLDGKLENPSGLWRAATEGDKKAIKQMVKYNKVDVEVLEKVYYKLLPYIRNHPSYGVILNSEVPVCSKCGSTHLQSRGTFPTTSGHKRRYQCMDCGGWNHDPTLIKTNVTQLRGC